jgi:hypothetical protein
MSLSMMFLISLCFWFIVCPIISIVLGMVVYSIVNKISFLDIPFSEFIDGNNEIPPLLLIIVCGPFTTITMIVVYIFSFIVWILKKLPKIDRNLTLRKIFRGKNNGKS